MVLTMAQRLTSVQLKVDLQSVPSVQDPCDQRQTTPQAHTNPDALGCNGLNASQETGIMQKHAANSRPMHILLVMVHQCFIGAASSVDWVALQNARTMKPQQSSADISL